MNPMQGVFHGYDIVGAGLRAEMQRAEVVSANLSNMSVVGNEQYEPYRRRSVIFEEHLSEAKGSLRGVEGADQMANGVRVARVYEDHDTPFVKVYDDSHPLADEDGFVLHPNVNMFKELVDMSIIERSFQANLAAMRSYRTMIQNTMANFSR